MPIASAATTNRLRRGKAGHREPRQGVEREKVLGLVPGHELHGLLRGNHRAVEREDERREEGDLRQADQPGDFEHWSSKKRGA